MQVHSRAYNRAPELAALKAPERCNVAARIGLLVYRISIYV